MITEPLFCFYSVLNFENQIDIETTGNTALAHCPRFYYFRLIILKCVWYRLTLQVRSLIQTFEKLITKLKKHKEIFISLGCLGMCILRININ